MINLVNISIGQRIKFVRELNNFSQEALAKKINVSDKTLSAWENDSRNISIENIGLISKTLSIPEEFVSYGIDIKIDKELKNKINEHLKKINAVFSLEQTINDCKQQLIKDGIEVKPLYLPHIDYNTAMFKSYGLFDKNNMKKYDILELIQNKLDNFILEKLYKDIKLEYLVNCNNLELFKAGLNNMSNGCTSKIKLYCSNEIPPTSPLNFVLENLNPTLPKYYEIIIWLIDNGAYYEKQIGEGYDGVLWKNVKDTSKTNFIYRLAKDMINKVDSNASPLK